MANRKVFVSGCYDLLHSGHVEFFRQASQYGDLYVGIGSDKTIEHLKGHKTLYNERERLFMFRPSAMSRRLTSIRVTATWISCLPSTSYSLTVWWLTRTVTVRKSGRCA